VISPSVVLAIVIGLFHVSAYVFIRGRAGARLPLLVIVAVLGAWAGDSLGARLGDPIAIGDFHLLTASLVAWLGIGLVAALAMLAPEAPAAERPARAAVVTSPTVASHARPDAEPDPAAPTGLPS
jgi:uncharacterized membrane protein YdjX (TVP38/TMEM64 family)